MKRYAGDGRGREGGRAAGTPNKVTQSARNALEKLLLSPKALKQMAKDLEQLQPYQRLQIQEKLLAYVLPRIQSTELQIEENFPPPRRLTENEAVELWQQMEETY
ncbi:MAG: hypothetical protein IKX59_02600 [Bacteroidales bacterium]|nr:hypothetical protein [Bacteroidales bacterium]